ncbi:hypothetical protein JCM10207_002922 [Rhodosporidiobolus poonsookiae]
MPHAVISKPSSSDAFFEAVEHRRSLYGLAKSSPISNDKIVEIVQRSIKQTPSPWNTQSSRAAVLFGEQHDRFWDLASERFQGLVPTEMWEMMKPKVQSHRASYATVLLFEDQDVADALRAKVPMFAPAIDGFLENVHGIAAFIAWTALEAEGLAANLQHFTEVVSTDVQKEWGVPASWKLRANLVIGEPVVPAGEKEFQPLEDRVKVFA